jgi:cyclopropane fatty-acyl-phospholipid synthase-like methyltransferase
MKSFWEGLNKTTAGDAILTGYTGQFKDMPVYEEVIDLAKGMEYHNQYALDFGCGVGRNSVALSNTYHNVISFDLPNMIDLVPQENKIENIVYTSNWEKIKGIPFDMVLASLVFQHIHDDELNKYLSELNTDKLVLHSRTWMDDTGTKVLTIVEQYFNIESIAYTKDPNGNESDHFLALLRSKNGGLSK